MFDNIHPDFKATLESFAAGAFNGLASQASELERDKAARELCGYVIGILRFAPDMLTLEFQQGLQARINKVRRAQGIADFVFVNETAEKIRAAAEPGFTRSTFEAIESELSRQMAEPKFDGDMIGAP